MVIGTEGVLSDSCSNSGSVGAEQTNMRDQVLVCASKRVAGHSKKPPPNMDSWLHPLRQPTCSSPHYTLEHKH